MTGAQTATATVAGTAVSQSFQTLVTAGAPARLAFPVQPSATPSGSAITPAPTVVAVDRLGNPVSTFLGMVTVALLANPANAQLTGTLAVSAEAGVAQFLNLSVSTAGTGFTVLATALDLVPDTSAAFDVTTTATAWDAAADFSIAVNPNGQWSSGWTATLGSAFTLYPQANTGGSMIGWTDPAIVNLGTRSFAKNVSASVQNGVPPGFATLHPGCNAPCGFRSCPGTGKTVRLHPGRI